MSIASKPNSTLPWFSLSLFGIFLGSLAIRFWGLGRFNTLVFDEVYYAKFASYFLKGEPIFTGHPPLSTYLIAFGIWVGEKLPWSNEAKNGLAGLIISPFSYRWLNAFVGSFLPLLVGTIAYQISQRRSYALITTGLIALDGLFLVESRYALNNVYLLLFGLLGQILFFLSLQTSHQRRWLWLIASGICFGATAAIKWNGLGFLLGIFLMWIAAWLWHWRQPPNPTPSQNRSPLQNLTQIHLGHVLVGLVLVPALTYYASWIPYMQVDPSLNFWELQVKTYDYHKRVGGLEAHPYCSLWFSWLFMFRPVAYFYKVTRSIDDPIPVNSPSMPDGRIIYDVHAMGNPFLWWFSTVAIVLFACLFIHQLWETLAHRKPTEPRSSQLTSAHWIVLYILLNWAANLLPWLSVKRCTFLYHYMPSLVFAILAFALIVDRWLQGPLYWRKITGISILIIIFLSFSFWLPLYLGLPLTPETIQIRRWFPSWI